MKPQQPSLFSQDEPPLTVHALTVQIKQLLESRYQEVAVTGEISNYRPASSGHHYFSLKDRWANLRCVLWRTNAARLKIELCEGMQVVLRGRIDVYAPRGDYQLDVTQVTAQGVGAQDLALRRLKERLQAEGYFERERKRPIPRLPRRIALVTSPHGAAVRDMLEILGRRWPAAEILVCPVRVQGTGANVEIARALHVVNRLGSIDTILLGRGGGRVEDLDAFNDEVVARAIFHSKIPIISAVGHEIDVTVADLVADQRALTPSEAAELATTPSRQDLLLFLDKTRGRLHEVLSERVRLMKDRLADLSGRRVLREPLDRLRELERRLEETGARMKRALGGRVQQQQQAVSSLASRLASLSPLNVLARGYSLTLSPEGNLIRGVRQVKAGDPLVIHLADGRLSSRVEEVLPADPKWQAKSSDAAS